jgi:outer membrane protein assembly factor BamB
MVMLWPLASGRSGTLCTVLGAIAGPRPPQKSATAAKTEPPDGLPIRRSPHSYAEPWSCFRGPRYGVSTWKNLPVAWDGESGLGVVWRTPLETSCVSSPVLWQDRIFLTEADEKGRALLAIDAESGRLVWRRAVADGGRDAPLPPVADSALALPTPACDAGGVYALFGTGDLVALGHDGKLKWQLFLKRPEIGYGYASSPCVVDGLVCVQFDELNGGRILAVEAASGKIRWEHPRSRGPSWASPVIVPGADGKPLVVVNANGSATAYDLAGKPVWDVEGVTGQVTPSPVWWNQRVYLANVGSRLICYDVSSSPREAWQLTGKLPDVSSPVVVDGLLFMATGNGQLTCVDAATGKELWNRKSPRCYASLVAGGGRVYALGRDGTMLIFAAERAYRELAACRLGDGSDATPALGDGRIYIRGRNHLWCLGEP